ncbi:MAG: class I SAM-dependent methyltransferase [Candidatus Omnitrophica bacterium]|nr:class I SAM-dependent methyltransferase [Candidatus Omnitrophota bacterium]
MLLSIYSGEYHSHAAVPGAQRGGFRVLKALCLFPYRLRFGNAEGTFSPFGEKRLLDIGCGTGDFLAAMAKKGWRCFGCDVSPRALEIARRKLPSAAFHCGRWEEAPFGRGPFEAITLWHTLEHLPDPLEALKSCRGLLAAGGRLVVAVPNLQSFEANLLGARWMEIDIPGHFFFFSHKTLTDLLERAGFRVVRIRPQVHPSTVSDSFDFILDDLLGRRRSRQRRWLYLLLFPLTAVSYAFGNWGCIEVTARKA